MSKDTFRARIQALAGRVNDCQARIGDILYDSTDHPMVEYKIQQAEHHLIEAQYRLRMAAELHLNMERGRDMTIKGKVTSQKTNRDRE